MQGEMTIRICSTCNKPLDFQPDGTQEGIIMGDEYYHDRRLCYKAETNGLSWDEFYEAQVAEYGEDDNPCYYTEWEPEFEVVT